MIRALAPDRNGRPRWTESFRHRVAIAAAGYVAVAIFGIGAVVARGFGMSVGIAATVGVLAAAPVVIALIGERITRIKGFGVEISLEKVTVDIAGDNSAIAAGLSDEFMRGAHTVMDMQDADTVMDVQRESTSEFRDLAGLFRMLIEQRLKLLRVNMRDNCYWLSTRLFLLAALAEDCTEVEALVFVQSGDAQVFVGIASPRAVRARLTALFPVYEVAYRVARATSGQYAIEHLYDDKATQMFDSLQQALQDVSAPQCEIQTLLEWRWREALDALGQPEDAIGKTVGSANIKEWLRGDLDTDSFSDGPLTPLRQYRIISRDRRYAALTGDRGRLETVVDRDQLAVRLATGYLVKALDGS